VVSRGDIVKGVGEFPGDANAVTWKPNREVAPSHRLHRLKQFLEVDHGLKMGWGWLSPSIFPRFCVASASAHFLPPQGGRGSRLCSAPAPEVQLEHFMRLKTTPAWNPFRLDVQQTAGGAKSSLFAVYARQDSSYFFRMRETTSKATASTLALRVLAWLAASQRLNEFLRTTGLTATELRSRADDPELLAGVLMYLLSNDGLAAQFCTQESVPPGELHEASRVLGVPS